jgi:hypothetical protein
MWGPLCAVLAAASAAACSGEDDPALSKADTGTPDSSIVQDANPATDGQSHDSSTPDHAVTSDGVAPDAFADSATPDGSTSDRTTPDAPSDGTTVDASVDSPTADSSPTDVATPDAPADSPTTDGSTTDSSNPDGATTDSMSADAPTDSAASGGDGSGSDSGGADGEAGASPQPLALCTIFDSKFGIDETDAGTAEAEHNRTSAWAFDVGDNFINSTGGYVGGDCSFSGFADAVSGLSDMGLGYTDFLNGWIQQFLGCPVVGNDGGALTFGLVPADLAPPGHVYTTADLDKLSSDFVDAINNTIACGGDCINIPDGGNLANVPPLTGTQIASIQAELAYLQSQVTYAPVDSGTFSFSPDPSCDPVQSCMALCPSADAGASDAADASSDAATPDASTGE